MKSKIMWISLSCSMAAALILSLYAWQSTSSATPTTKQATTSTPAIEPEISFSDGVPIVPSIRPVIIVSGTDYEIGYQWFQQHAQIFGTWILEEMRKELTADQIDVLKANEVLIEKYTPEWIDIMKGMAKGATDAGVPLSYEEVMAEFVVTTPPAADASPGAAEEPMSEACSGFAAWGSTTKDGKLVGAGIGDSHLVKFEHTVMVYPETGSNFIISPYYREDRKPGRAWSPLHPGMNNKGLAYFHHGAGTTGNAPEDQNVIPTPFSVMHTLRFADNAKQALEMLVAYPGARSKGLWADVGGDGFVIECRDPLTIRRAGDCGEKDCLYATNNIMSKDLGKFVPGQSETSPATWYEYVGWFGPYSAGSISRNLEMWNMLHNYRGKVDADFVKMMLRFPGEADWASAIGNLKNEMVGALVPDNGDNGLMWVSSGHVGRNAYPQGPLKGFLVAPTFSFYQLRLDSGPVKVVDAAVTQAMNDLYRANQELRKLTYRDVAYAPLDKIYDKAAIEWTKGMYYQKLAKTTSGNESVNYYGKTLRALTRCQAYANQIYEALIPPADDPTDLGLGAYLGTDGDWAEMPEGYPPGAPTF